jgi:hypothetical protein
MIEYLRLQMKIWRLERAYAAEEKGTEKAVERAKARGAFGEIEGILGGNHSFIHRRKIREAQSDYLLSEADRLIVPVPDWNNPEMWDDDGERRHLSREGLKQLRSDIRAEKKARAERLLIWVPAVVGIIGALTGLAAIVIGTSK